VTLASVLSAAAGVGLAGWWVSHARRPRGIVGRMSIETMAATHTPLTDWALAQLAIASRRRCLDVGCGAGRAIEQIAASAPAARIDGVDYSPTSVAAARRRNAALVESGRVAIQVASVAALPFADATFDLVTAVETHYYWPDLRANLREVRRVLEPGGEVAIIAEAHRGGPFAWLYAIAMFLVRGALLTAAEHEAALRDAGFEQVSVTLGRNRTWILARGRRPQRT
jgi:ubiquinone/menaquinone biosynthesis C-methylase UbiE